MTRTFFRNRLQPSPPKVRPSSRRAGSRALRMEQLEHRLLLARAALLTQTFREDDFSVSGDFTYELRSPEDFDYIDTISNGKYTSTSGNVKWLSPTLGDAFFEGKATGDGRDTVNFAGRRTCSEYGIEDIGRLDFTVDLAAGTLKVDRADATSTRYTYYFDRTGGFCEQPDPPWSRFFGGFSSEYEGVFNPATHQVSFTYDDDNPDMHVVSPAAPVQWSNTAVNDLVLTARPVAGDLNVPDGFIDVEQTTFPPDELEALDVRNGGLQVTATLAGKPLKISTPATPVANIRLFWATSEFDIDGPEIPITEGSPVGIFWNSAVVSARVDKFPVPPPNAKFVRVAVLAGSGIDSNAANSTQFIPIADFQARDSVVEAVNEDFDFDGTNASVLHQLDRNAGIRVFAYQETTQLGGSFAVLDDTGAYYYSAGFSEEVQELGAGEMGQDFARIIAVKDQSFLDEALVTIPIRGENDLPFADTDNAATTNLKPITLSPNLLLGNDSDPDRNDVLRLTDADTTSAWGAEIRIVWNDSQTQIQELIYDPSKSASLRSLPTGDKVEDSFLYEIMDLSGETAWGVVVVEVTGEVKILRVPAIDPQYTAAGTASPPIFVAVEDSNEDAEDVELTVTAADRGLVPQTGIEVTKFGGGSFSLSITPSANVTGRTQITVQARNDAGETATTQFLLTVGSETDLDLDGVPNEIEDAGPNGGDMNFDGILDSQQGYVAAVRTLGGDTYLSVAVDPTNILADVSVTAAPAASGPADDAAFPVGVIQFEVLTSGADSTVTATLRSDFSTVPLNRVFGRQNGQWQSLMYNKRDGAKVFVDYIEIAGKDGWRGDTAAAAGTVGFSIGLGNVNHPWQNRTPEDIDNDGVVAPIDVLLLINQINNFGSRALGKSASVGQPISVFLDPSGSDSLEPIDALIVINFLNDPSGEGERRSVAMPLTSGTASVNLTGRDRRSSAFSERVLPYLIPHPQSNSSPSPDRDEQSSFADAELDWIESLDLLFGLPSLEL